MVRDLLVRGMLVGIVAGLLAFACAKLIGEPQVDRAIAFEQAESGQTSAAPHTHDHGAASMPAGHAGMAMSPQEAAEPELVSRATQAGLGLFTGVMVYCTAFGGLFGLVFAVADRRIGRLGPRGTAALLAVLGLIAVSLVPALKYPPNPPAVGEAETIATRTGFYFLMLLLSVVAMTAAVMLRQRLAGRHGAWNAALIAGAAYAVAMAAALAVLPAVNEVPDGFPATLLWQFRMAALGMQVVMWATLGLLFGWLTERAAAQQRRAAFGGVAALR
ncbi:MAG: CbtA family protein [Proteobacteria bacterium]|nr:CbtA family protein [Pseudomonadota bacterium]